LVPEWHGKLWESATTESQRKRLATSVAGEKLFAE
jgi:hypothetical protein